MLIKLADRLHNMRTIEALPQDKQARIARQTAEIYAPLAERLGIWQIKWELEDLAFKILDPTSSASWRRSSRRTARSASATSSGRMAMLQATRSRRQGIEAEISGRPKHIYSIWKKMQRKGAGFDEIYDVHAVRVLVEDVQDCYAALGIVHSLWRPIPGPVRRLHRHAQGQHVPEPAHRRDRARRQAARGADPHPRRCTASARYGIAAHWRYKEGGKGDRDYDAKLAWLRQLMDWQRDVTDATEFVEAVKLDVFQDQVFVFTPKGDVKDLPAGSTPLDFAYRIHTDVGHSTIGAKVNNRLVPLDYKLKNGDIVEIVTTKAARRAVARLAGQGPHRPRQRKDPAVVQAAGARREHRPRPRVTGSRAAPDGPLVAREARTGARQRNGRAVQVPDGRGLLRRNWLRSGGQHSRSSPAWTWPTMPNEMVLPQVAPHDPAPRTGGVRVKGVGDLMTRFARCCHPIPGDPIIGYITRGRGVTIHLPTCSTVVNEKDIGRLIEVEWEGSIQQTYPIAIRVEAYDRPGLLSEITNVVAENKVNIIAANMHTNPDHTATFLATLQVSSVAQLAKVLSRIEQVKDVHTVQRDMS